MNKNISPPINIFSYEFEIFNKVYPDFLVRNIFNELKSIVNEITYLPVWNYTFKNFEDFETQQLKIERFIWLEKYKSLMPQSFDYIQQQRSNNKLLFNITDAVNLIQLILREVNLLVKLENENVKKIKVNSKNNYSQWKKFIQDKGAKKTVESFVSFISNTKPAGLEAVLLHGSLSDGEVKPGFSDFDVHYVIDLSAGKEEIISLMKWIFISNKFLLSYNPFMHHGPMLVLKDELLLCSEAIFPSTLIENGIWLLGKVDEISYSRSDFELINTYKIFEDFFNNKFHKSENIKSVFDLIWWVSSVLFLPLLNIQLQNNKSYWKKEVLTNKLGIPEKYWNLIDHLTKIRNNVSEYVQSKSSIPIRCAFEEIHPGYVLAKYKNEFSLHLNDILALGLNDELIESAKEYYNYCVSIAAKINEVNFIKKGYDYNKVKDNWIKDVCEIPSPIPLAKYQEVRSEFIRKCESNNNVIAVYEFGSIGCPGLSDLDFLVVLSDDYFGLPDELLIENMSVENADVMNHDPVFISESQIKNFAALSPIFFYNRTLGKDLELFTTESFSDDIQEICFTLQNITKYPADLISLSKQKKIRWKTLLAFLNSFNHVKKTILVSCQNLPESIQECIDLNKIIRSKFQNGVCNLEDLNLAFDKMIAASVDIVLFYQHYWEKRFLLLKSETEKSDFYDYRSEVYRALNNKEDVMPELPVSLKLFIELTQDLSIKGSNNFKVSEKSGIEAFLFTFNSLKKNYLINELSKGRKISSYIFPQKIVNELICKYYNIDTLLRSEKEFEFHTPVLFIINAASKQTYKSFYALKNIRPKILYVYINSRTSNIYEDEELKTQFQILFGIDWNCELKTKIKTENIESFNLISDSLTWFFDNEQHGIIYESQNISEPEYFYSIQNLLKENESNQKVLSFAYLNVTEFNNVKKSPLYLLQNTSYTLWAMWRKTWRMHDDEMQGYLSFISTNSLDYNPLTQNEFENIESNLFSTYCKQDESFFTKWNFDILNKDGSIVILTKNPLTEELDYHTIHLPQINSNESLNINKIERLFYPIKLNILIYKSEAAIEKNNLSLAKNLLNTVLKLDSNNLDALNNLAVVKTMEDQYAEAVNMLKKVISIDPGNEVAIENLLILKGLLEEKALIQKG